MQTFKNSLTLGLAVLTIPALITAAIVTKKMTYSNYLSTQITMIEKH